MPEELSDSVAQALGLAWGELLALPWPWRPAIVVFLVELLLALSLLRVLPGLWRLGRPTLRWVVGTGGALMLLPEYLLTTLLRRHGRRPLPGTHLMGDLVLWGRETALVALAPAPTAPGPWRKIPIVSMIFIASMPIILWYARPYVRTEPKVSGAIEGALQVVKWGEGQLSAIVPTAPEPETDRKSTTSDRRSR